MDDLDNILSSYLLNLFLLIIAISFIFKGIKTYIKTNKIEENGIETEGTVIAFKTIPVTDDDIYSEMIYPIVSYNDNQGNEYASQLNIGNSSKTYSLGDKIKIIFNSQRPAKVVTKQEIAILPYTSTLAIIFGFFILAYLVVTWL